MKEWTVKVGVGAGGRKRMVARGEAPQDAAVS